MNHWFMTKCQLTVIINACVIVVKDPYEQENQLTIANNHSPLLTTIIPFKTTNY